MKSASGLGLAMCVVVSCHAMQLRAIGPAQASTSDLAGEYYNGPGISGLISVSIDGDGSYCFERSSDVGSLESGCGRVLVEDGWIRFSGDESGDLNRMTREPWRFVPWGERRYLIPESSLMSFVNYVNTGSEPRTEEAGLFLFREGDSQREARGRPNLPSEWLSFLLQEDLEGEVVRIVDTAEAEIDLGDRQGLRPGMRLLARVSDGWVPVVVVTTQTNISTVRLEYDWQGPLSVGQEIVSRWPTGN